MKNYDKKNEEKSPKELLKDFQREFLEELQKK